MDITGQLLDVETNKGSWTPPGQTEEVPFDNATAFLLVGRRQVKVKARGDDKARLLALREQIGKQVTISVRLPETLSIGPAHS